MSTSAEHPPPTSPTPLGRPLTDPHPTTQHPTTQPPAEPHLLELRIHGVNNTPVTDVLGLPADQIVQSDGDDLGSFWTPKAEALDRARAAAERRWGAGHPTPGATDWVPPDFVHRHVRREAYSWGALSRHSGHVPGGEGSIGVRLTRAGWLLLTPLGITNAAYWSRRLVADVVVRPTAAGADQVRRRYGRGLAPIQLFGLGLTLLLVAALQAVALDMVATQCLGAVSCPGAPGWMSGLSTLPWGRRMTALALVPVLGLVLLQWLSASSRVRYEVPVHAGGPPAARAATPGAAPGVSGDTPVDGSAPTETVVPVLAQPDLWQRWRLSERTSSAHLSAGLSLVALTLAWSGLWGPERSCRQVTDLLDGTCSLLAADRPQFALLATLSLVAFVGSASLLTRRTYRPRAVPVGEDELRLVALRWVVGTGVLLTVVALAMWIDAADPARPSVPGLSLVPGVLAGLLLLVALVGLTFRRGTSHTRLATAGALLLGGGAAWTAWPGAGAGPAPVVVSLLGVALLVGVVVSGVRTWAGNRRDTSAEAWWGGAPGVFLLLALGLQMTLTGIVVVAVGDWLNGDHAAVCLIPLADAGEGDCPSGGLELPAAYAAFISGVAGGLVLTIAFALVPPARRLLHRLDLGSPGLVPAEPEGLGGEREPGWPGAVRTPGWLGAVRQRAGTIDALVTDAAVRAAVLRARGRADLLQRAESVLGAVAVGLALALVWTVLITPGRGWLVEHAAGLIGQLTVVGLWVIVAGWTYGVARVLTTTGTEARPGGLLWDLMCFLPRTAHPFGPPCYAERAVPEIAARVDAWLDAVDLPPAAAPERAARRVVLAPHSMGVVLAIAALMLPQGRALRAGRVALLSYGTQVRPYFGRFFPELLGPGPIGTPPVRCAGFAGCVWQESRPVPPSTDDVPSDRLVDLLARPAGGLLWLNLWRPTDPLGMQVGLKEVDLQAEEVDAAGYLPEVATHGGYPRTVAYRAALEELDARLADPCREVTAEAD